MKSFRSLMESLPSSTIVMVFGRFNPPHQGHALLVMTATKIAQQLKADHVVFASKTQDKKKNPLSVDRKLHYLKLMFPRVNFVGANERIRTFMEAAKELNKRYKNLVMVAGSDRVDDYKTTLEKYNGTEYNFDTIRVISAGERDPDSDDVSGLSASKMRAAATKGDFQHFKQGLPSALRDIDAKRLMNDVREGLGLDVIKEQIQFPKDELREQYVTGKLFAIGQLVEDAAGDQFTITKRGTNYVLAEDASGKLISKWIHEIHEVHCD